MKPITCLRIPTLLAVLLILLQACQSAPPQRDADDGPGSVDAAQRAEQAGQWVRAAREYERLARSSPAPRRQDLQLAAVELLLRAGQVGDARTKIAEIDIMGLPPGYMARRQILQARVAIAENRPDQALRLLQQAERLTGLDPELFAEIHRTRAQAELESGDTIAAVASLIGRERYMVADTEIAENRRQLWSLLAAEDRESIEEGVARATDPVLAGWLELALVVLDHPPGSHELALALGDWKASHPSHPAVAGIFPVIAGSAPGLIGPVQEIALLLPLTSPHAHAAQAVRDGFLAMDAANPNPAKPRIRIHDIGDDPFQAASHYADAVASGAQLVVGPLGLEATENVARNARLSVPTLLLSHVEVETQEGDVPVFQFGLSPEQEARQAAERAYLDGHRTAAILYPESAWGQRMVAAFTEYWQQLGGFVAVAQTYPLGGNDYSEPVRQLLNIPQSEARQKALEQRLGTRLKFEPRRRGDVDMLFLAADAKHGRLIKPQLNYFRASDLPTYATSHIFTGKADPALDVDLDGIMFGDMPWMLVTGGPVEELRLTLQRDWPYAHTPADRLFAFGMDAYSIIPHLNRMLADRSTRFNGVTSGLGLDPDGRLHRQLLWARFNRGVPRLLDTFLNYDGYAQAPGALPAHIALVPRP